MVGGVWFFAYPEFLYTTLTPPQPQTPMTPNPANSEPKVPISPIPDRRDFPVKIKAAAPPTPGPVCAIFACLFTVKKIFYLRIFFGGKIEQIIWTLVGFGGKWVWNLKTRRVSFEGEHFFLTFFGRDFKFDTGSDGFLTARPTVRAIGFTQDQVLEFLIEFDIQDKKLWGG